MEWEMRCGSLDNESLRVSMTFDLSSTIKSGGELFFKTGGLKCNLCVWMTAIEDRIGLTKTEERGQPDDFRKACQ